LFYAAEFKTKVLVTITSRVAKLAMVYSSRSTPVEVVSYSTIQPGGRAVDQVTPATISFIEIPKKEGARSKAEYTNLLGAWKLLHYL
jgi:hypothetical protein